MGCTASKPVSVSQLDKVESSKGNNASNVVSSGSAKRTESSSNKGSIKTNTNGAAFTQLTNEKCPHIRLDHCKEPKILAIEGNNYKYNMKYCYVSQRGYYPNAMGKANQDSYLVGESVLNDESCNVFGIFDGHGEYGDFCSFFCADAFSGNLIKELDDNGGLSALNGPKMESIYTKAFTKTNLQMGKSNIDDTLSGTTGVTVIQKGDQLIVGNVGDSRAIIASMVDGKLKYAPLSNDQTPYRKDERERLKKLGARIMTIEQIEGNEPMHENWGTELGEEIDEVQYRM